MRRSPPHCVKNPPVPTPTPHVGPFVMSVEFPTPSADEPTYRVPYEEVPTLAEAVAWIRHPPFPPETLKKLKKGVLLTARVRAEWVMENGHHGEEVAAMGLVLKAGTKSIPTRIAVIAKDGISVDGKKVSAESLGLRAKAKRAVAVWLAGLSAPKEMLDACVGIPLQLLTLTACAVARTVLQFVTANESSLSASIVTSEMWAVGSATPEEVERASSEARKVSWGGNWASEAVATAARVAKSGTPVQAAAWTANCAIWQSGAYGNLARIVREWVGLPEVAYAAITRQR